MFFMCSFVTVTVQINVVVAAVAVAAAAAVVVVVVPDRKVSLECKSGNYYGLDVLIDSAVAL